MDLELEGNNVRGKIAEKRDILLQAEKEYLEELMQFLGNKEFRRQLNKCSASFLAGEADKRINRIENGEVKAEMLERVEAEITLIYAAIQDKIRERVKEKTMEIKKPKQKTIDEDELER